MIVNLIKSKQIFSLTLPQKVKGQYWVSDIDCDGKPRQLISVEAVDGEWVLKSNKKVSVSDGQNNNVEQVVLNPQSFFHLQIKNEEEKVILFSESIDASRQTFWKIVARNACDLKIGRSEDNELCFGKGFVSGKHAMEIYGPFKI